MKIRDLISRLLDSEWAGWTLLVTVGLLMALGIVKAAELVLLVLP